MSADDVKVIMQRGRDFIAKHLVECIKELQIGAETGTIPLGKLVDARTIYLQFDSRHGIQMADNEVKRQAFQAVVAQSDDAALLDWVMKNSPAYRFIPDERFVWWTYINGALVGGCPSHTYRDAIRAAMAKQAEEKAAK